MGAADESAAVTPGERAPRSMLGPPGSTERSCTRGATESCSLPRIRAGSCADTAPAPPRVIAAPASSAATAPAPPRVVVAPTSPATTTPRARPTARWLMELPASSLRALPRLSRAEPSARRMALSARAARACARSLRWPGAAASVRSSAEGGGGGGGAWGGGGASREEDSTGRFRGARRLLPGRGAARDWEVEGSIVEERGKVSM